MKHVIIGTAGHVDHGKTALVRALTGIDTDRLKEEKDRGISIELGFAYLDLPDGRRAGLVDVPGHERFIKNMLAGAGGFDLVLLVIAADEGIMPQTREHLDIIQLLQVKKGIVAITKVDLVDQEWLDLVIEDVKEFLKGTVLENSPLVTVSSITGRGIAELRDLIGQLVLEAQARISHGPPRLPVDRLFTITGFGTVVTGTLGAGSLRVGDTVEVLPQGFQARVRSIQVHGDKTGLAEAGQRVAVNLAGLELEQIERGSVVAGPKTMFPSLRLDVRLLLLKEPAKNLKNRARVRFYLGTRETLGRVVLLDREQLKPGDVTYAQLELEDYVVAAKGDRFVIRSYSPMRTIGGGTVIDPLPRRKRKRFNREVLEALATREKGTPAELVAQYLGGRADLPGLAETAQATGLEIAEVEKAARNMSDQEKVKTISGEGKVYLLLTSVYREWAEEISKALASYHRDYPLRDGCPKEDLRSRKFPAINHKVFQLMLNEMEREGLFSVTAQIIALKSFAPGPDRDLRKKLENILYMYKEEAFQPPAWGSLGREAGLKDDEEKEVLQYLLRTGELVKVAEDLYFHSEVIDQARARVSEHLRRNGKITVGELRDVLQTSRKFALPLLEYFDQIKLTKRVGDLRLPGRMMD